MTPDEALRTIATFDIAAHTVVIRKGQGDIAGVALKIRRGEYVPVGHARYLRELARKALGLPLNDPPKAPAAKGVS